MMKLKNLLTNLLKKITENLENFSYNKIVANFHEMYSFLLKTNKKKLYKKNIN